jgi:FkbM family methyltransferase
MRNPFDLTLPGGVSVGDVIMAPLMTQGVEPLVVDVGARNGMSLLPATYCRSSHLISFEPNIEEFKKLEEGTTDAVKAGLPPAPTFKSTRFKDCALWDKAERRSFYVTVGAGACTMMGATRENITGRMYLDAAVGSTDKSYTELHTKVRKTEEVACRSLDEIVPTEVIDFLKLDVEGAELRVLQGSDALLQDQRVLFIKSEFVCLGYYDEHPVFGDLHARLNKMGYRLLDIDFDQPVYSRSPTRIPRTVDRRLKYAGDAYFALDPDHSDLEPLTLQRLAAISLIMGFRSFAVSLLRDAALISPDKIDDIEDALSRIPMAKKLVNAWRQVPFIALRWLTALGIRV